MKVKLGDVCEINPKVDKLPNDTQVSFIPMQNVTDDGKVDSSTIRTIEEVKKGFTSFRENDVLFAKITPCMENGKGGSARNLKNGFGFGSTEFHVLRPSSSVTSEWLYYLLSWPVFRKECEKNMTGSAGQKRVPKSFLENYTLRVPPLDDQRRIAAVLYKVSDMIAKRREQLDKLDELVKARFVEMFGNCNYPRQPLISLIKEGTGLSYGIVQPGDDGTGDLGVIRPVDMVDGNISIDSIKHIDRAIGDSFKKTELTGDELLITVRGTTGITALTDVRFKGMNVTRGIAVIRYNRSKINPAYLNAYLNTAESQNYIQEHTRGATLQQINLSDLRIQEILLPPMYLQEHFSDYATLINKSKLTIQQSLDKMETLKKALMQEYFG